MAWRRGPTTLGRLSRRCDFVGPDLVLATKGDGTAWTSGFDPETGDACAVFNSNYVGCDDSAADPTICSECGLQGVVRLSPRPTLSLTRRRDNLNAVMTHARHAPWLLLRVSPISNDVTCRSPSPRGVQVGKTGC